MNVRCEFGQEGLDSGSAVPRLAVPCGTHCWLPLWHLFFPALTPCVRMLFHPAVRTRRTVRSSARIVGRWTGFIYGSEGGSRRAGRTGRRGHFGSPSVRETSSKDTERRDEGRIQSAQCVGACFCLGVIRVLFN